MFWHDIWEWLTKILDSLTALIASTARDIPVWVLAIVFACLAFEGTRHFVRLAKVKRHVREFERAELEHRLGVIEKPGWERKRNKEILIDNTIYHPVQRDPGGIWLQLAQKQDYVKSRVLLVSNLDKLIHNTVVFHSSQHRKEAAAELVLGVTFLSLGTFIGIAYTVLYLTY